MFLHMFPGLFASSSYGSFSFVIVHRLGPSVKEINGSVLKNPDFSYKIMTVHVFSDFFIFCLGFCNENPIGISHRV